MDLKGTHTMDKTMMVVQGLHETSDELVYWQSKTPQERLEALEQMRQIIYGYGPTTTRLQRFFEVAPHPSC